MSFHFNSISIALLMSGVGTFLMSVLIFQRLGGAVKWFAMMMLCIALWSVCYAFELASHTLEQMLFWIKFEYIGITFLPTTWIIFVFRFMGKEEWLTLRNRIIIFSFPVLALLFVWTNEHHHIHYESVSVDNSGPFPLLAIQKGIWYYIHMAFFYFMLAWGIILLINHARRADPVYKNQNRAIIFAAFIPWVVNLLYHFGLRPFGHVDLTPFAFIVTSATIGFSLIRFNLFDLVPLAREKVLESMDEGILVLDSYKRVIDINGGMNNFLPAGVINPVGKYLSDIFPDAEPLLNAIEEGRDRMISLNYHTRFYEVDLTNVIDQSSVNRGILLIFWDVTEKEMSRQQLQQQAHELMELNKLKDRIFSIISHDLRSPLASIVSMLNISKDGDITDEEFRSFLPALSHNVEYTSGLIENLLYWSKSQLEGESIQKEKFDLKEMVQGKIRVYNSAAANKNITLRENLHQETYVVADMNMIRLVLRNLLSNAIKFCRAGDSITISARSNDSTTTLCVSDTGVGMSPGTMAQLFTPDVKSKAGTNMEQGTGLGLVLCKDFIEKNGGRIWVESEPGKGSRFCFELRNH